MKVLLINKTNTGGGAAVAANRLNRALRRNGLDVNLMVQDLGRPSEGTFSVGSGPLYKQRAFARFIGERLYFLPHEKSPSVRFAFSPANTGIDISDHPLVKEADIIHLHWINQGFLSLKSLDKLLNCGKPIVWTQHDMWAFTGGCHYAGSCSEFTETCSFCPFLRKASKNDLSTRIFNEKRKAYSKAPITVVTCSKWLKGLVQESKLLRDKHALSIPNPIDTSFYRPMDKADARTRLGLPANKKLLLFGAANVNDPRKGMRYFIEAINLLGGRIEKCHEHIELIVFGKMDNAQLADMPLKVHPFRFVKDPNVILDLYNAANAYVLPSLQDNLPNTVMEAMACGTPVVGFSIGGVPEMVTHRKSGYLAEARNAMSLAAGIQEVLFEDNGQKMGQEARAKAESSYAEDVVAKQYIALYETLMR